MADLHGAGNASSHICEKVGPGTSVASGERLKRLSAVTGSLNIGLFRGARMKVKAKG